MERQHAVTMARAAQVAAIALSAAARSRCLSSVSIITLPTKWILAGSIPSALRFSDASVIGGEQRVAQHVGHHPVDLLGHRPVAAAQSGLYVRHLDAQLLGRQSAGYGRVDVADHHHPIGLALEEQRLKCDHHASGLLGVSSGPDLEIDIGPGQSQIGEEGARHLRVVMLPGVHQEYFQVGMACLAALERLDQGRHLHEVRPCSRYN